MEIGRKTETWGSKFGFIMAAVGSSVGLGNFWRFPYTAGENGGGAFIVIYLLCVAFIGLPLLMAEYSMGRKSGMSAIEGVQSLARAEGKSLNWGIVGWVGTITATFILSFYVVISSWLIAFTLQAMQGKFTGMNAEASGQNFEDLIGIGAHPMASKWYILALLALFLAANVWIVGRGVKGGIERAATVLMPAFFIMLVVVVGFAIANGDAAAAAEFLLTPKWEDVGFNTFLEAIGQAFFSIGIGVGLMITYGAYLSRDTNIPRASGIVAGSDTTVALIAGFAIFPIVFAAGLDPAGGPSLFFVSMPVAFGSIPGGELMAVVFFGLALFAAFTSSISLMEVSVSWLEERQGVTRFGAALGMGVILFVVGAAYVFSLDYLDFVDFLTGNLLLPLGGLLAVIFAGWILSRDMMTSEIGEGTIMNVWRFLLRWPVPLFLAFILFFGFFDKIQQQYNVQLPGFMTALLGPNNELPAE
ncbi:sodium-dependent transporter [Henriciella mobilis]|uniref:sodium-dependent transporter n=1 Tax=Henriciella mobilis TaxID=2305467 RepID=UPI000E67171D|nr:sodium-dependent transporter [Henriciella mobilis]RIJ16059.1 sodium-dependent transporter [Henriciella mobilis]RIJ23030.1 sodium-dependent transporter [Henriciella mobilis]